jgi:hypothetical protein
MEKRQKATAGPSTSLRSAQDDSIEAGIGWEKRYSWKIARSIGSA